MFKRPSDKPAAPGTPRTTLSAEQKAGFEQAFGALGMSVQRWKDDTATIRREEGKLDLDVSLLARQLPPNTSVDDPRALAVLVAPMLGMSLPHDVLAKLDEARSWLRPRLIKPDELSGPRRNMCRRQTFAGLLRAISIGPGNLRRSLLPDDIHEVDQSFGTLAIIHDSEPAAPACFIFDTLLPHWQPESGAVFAIPTEDTCLVLPVMHGMGAEALADFVQMSFNLFGRTEDALCDQLIWATGAEIDGHLDPTPRFRHLPITKVEERTGKRVHLEAEGAMGDLLRVLGAIG